MVRYDEELGKWLAGRLEALGIPAEPKKMFGHEAWFLNTYMYCGANELGVFVHVGKDAVDEALATIEGVAAFSPGRGVVMKDYLVLEEVILSDNAVFEQWLRQSAEYLHARPPKIKKAKRKGR